ncbi:MAG: cbb3-type cytochrome c oxidase subunit II [Vicinamibacterales bacterium]
MSRGSGRALRMAYVVASVAGVLFFALSVALLGEWPRRVLEAETAAMAPPHPLAPSASELRGRDIYGREGCAYCHTQQVRYLATDMARFGAPTLAWETRFDFPQLWGTRRIGPDLARESGARPADWQLTHLFAPRSVVPTSVMPAYPWLFDGAPDRPRQDARDLVAYLDSLGRARALAWPEGDRHAREACNCPDDHLAQLAFAAPELSAHPGRARRGGEVPGLPAGGDATRGTALFARHCAGCHGDDGRGQGAGAAGLLPRPSNLVDHEYTTPRLAEVLWNGVAGTAMPGWRDLPPADLAALAAAVRALHRPAAETALPEGLETLGARVYVENCVQCHGETGDGDGFGAAKLTVPPADLRGQRPSLAESLRVLREGIDGTQMAPWTSRLSEAEIVAVAHYVRRFFQDAEAGGGR